MADLTAIVVADVIATMMWWIFYHFQYYVMLALPWLMLLPIFIIVADLIAISSVVDVVTTFHFVAISLYCKVADIVAIICGRWKTTICLYVMLADVIAMVVDGTTQKVSKVKEIPTKGQNAAPKLVAKKR